MGGLDKKSRLEIFQKAKLVLRTPSLQIYYQSTYGSKCLSSASGPLRLGTLLSGQPSTKNLVQSTNGEVMSRKRSLECVALQSASHLVSFWTHEDFHIQQVEMLVSLPHMLDGFRRIPRVMKILRLTFFPATNMVYSFRRQQSNMRPTQGRPTALYSHSDCRHCHLAIVPGRSHGTGQAVCSCRRPEVLFECPLRTFAIEPSPDSR